MKPSENDSNQKPDNLSLREEASPYALELPILPEEASAPPKGTWEDGYRLSLIALESVKNRPEIFEERAKRMCAVEFKM
ncbi:MAG: hypothetical protein AB1705_01185 [Verrucomicrobiota bacterium]